MFGAIMSVMFMITKDLIWLHLTFHIYRTSKDVIEVHLTFHMSHSEMNTTTMHGDIAL